MKNKIEEIQIAEGVKIFPLTVWQTEEVTVKLLKIDFLQEDEIFQKIYCQLGKSRRQKVDGMKMADDRLRSAAAGILLQTMLATKMNISLKQAAEIAFETNPYGKETISGRDDIWFNLSHSGEYVLCGVADQKIGVDLQEKRGLRMQVAKRFFTEHECKDLQKSSPKQQEEIFYKIWTAKEAYSKWLGVGLVKPMNSYEIDPFEEKIYEMKELSREDVQSKETSTEDGFQKKEGILESEKKMQCAVELKTEQMQDYMIACVVTSKTI